MGTLVRMIYLNCFPIIAILEQEVQVQDSFISITEIAIPQVLKLLRNHGTVAKVRENLISDLEQKYEKSYLATGKYENLLQGKRHPVIS